MRKVLQNCLMFCALTVALNMQAQTVQVTTKHYLVVDGENKELTAAGTQSVEAGAAVRPYAHAYIVADAYEVNDVKTENTKKNNSDNTQDGNYNATFFYTATTDAEQEVTFYYRETLPFITSSNTTTDAYWYNLRLYTATGLNEYWLGAEDDGTASIHWSRQPKLNILWCFVGNLVDGFYIYSYDGRKLSYNSEKPVVSSTYNDRWHLQLPTTGDPYESIRISKADNTTFFANEGREYVEYTTDATDERANIKLFWTGDFLYEFLKRSRESQENSYAGALGSFLWPETSGDMDAIDGVIRSYPGDRADCGLIPGNSTFNKTNLDELKDYYYENLKSYSKKMTESFVPIEITDNGNYFLYNKNRGLCITAGEMFGDVVNGANSIALAENNTRNMVKLISTSADTYKLSIQGAFLSNTITAMTETEGEAFVATIEYQGDSKFHLKNSDGKYLRMGMGGKLTISETADANSEWYLISVPEYVLTLGGPYSSEDLNRTYATRCLPFTVQIPAGVRLEAYIAKDDVAGYVILEEIEEEADGSIIVPAETPVMFIGEGLNEITLNVLAGDYADKKPAENDFSGTLFKSTPLDASISAYGLGHNGSEAHPRFYKLSSDPAKRSIAANRAYLVAPSGGAAKAMRFKNDATGINSAVVDQQVETTFYDLNGRRVLYPTRGIYVTGSGQKVFIK